MVKNMDEQNTNSETWVAIVEWSECKQARVWWATLYVGDWSQAMMCSESVVAGYKQIKTEIVSCSS